MAQTIDYSVQANIIYRVTKYIDWPDDKVTGDFVIGIVGDSPLFDELQKATLDKNFRGHKITVKNFSPSADIHVCSMLVITQDESSSLKKILTVIQYSPVLIVTEEEGLAKRGACINIVISGERLKLEINRENIERRNLKVASEFLELGTTVK